MVQLSEQQIDLLGYIKEIGARQDRVIDSSQINAIYHLNFIYDYLQPTKHWQLFSKPCKHVYLWGEVGSGKTWLMDAFYEALPIDQKLRIHFHHFLKQVHQRLVQLRGYQNPIKVIADEFIRQYRVICFDELFIGNVADAMILGDLLSILLQSKLIFVFTSNCEPSKLFKKGHNRERLEPMLELLEKNCSILKIGIGKDYRKNGYNDVDSNFRYPLDKGNAFWLAQQFNALCELDTGNTKVLVINGRELKIIRQSSTILWCKFDDLCRAARSPADYIELAKKYEIFLISDIPQLNDKLIDPTRRFIYLIDELYDRKKAVYLIAATDLDQLYQGDKLAFEFKRTQSRLFEMCFNHKL